MHTVTPPTHDLDSRPYLHGFDFTANERALRSFASVHRGERCVIMGNGPSLARTDLSLIRDMPTFGLNKIFLHFPAMGWEPTYLVAINPLVVQQSVDVFSALTMPLFLGHEALKYLEPRPGMAFLMSWNPEPHFSADATRNLWQGHTVTYCALQLAYFMGFAEVILVGVDHRFTFTGDPNQLQTMDGDDPNHFHPGYFKGSQWHTPDLERSELAYTLAREAFAADGRRVVDATIDGELTVFPKARLEDLI